MQVVTYLGFTLLSIFIQFSVIDFIQGRLKLDDEVVDLKGTTQKRQLRDILKDVTHKPHALYYRTQKSRAIKNHTPARIFSNTSLSEFFTTTDMTTTVFDILYDENTTGTEESFTTESLYTSSDIENITEVNFFGKTNDTTPKADMVPKIANDDCKCNFLFRVCDINCCCDSDCLDSEKELFPNCVKNKSKFKQDYDDCVYQLPYFGYENGLFCIVKINLPSTPLHQKVEQKAGHFMTWKSTRKPQNLYEFSNKIYQYGDPIWIIRNGTIYHNDLPSQTVNNYCTGRKAIQFLKDENYSCNVKLRDLEMLQIMKNLVEISVISATELSMNSSILNCSTLHCVNWTIIVCNKYICTNNNKSLHEPTCTESTCTNIPLRINYIFYYHESKIINATIKFHLENVTMDLPFVAQEIKVNFVLGNKTVDNIIKLSGNPGYEHGLPIIASFAEKNHSDIFYNHTMQTKKYLILPENQHGICMYLNDSNNFILFGQNKRMNCRYNHTCLKFVNSTDECNKVQNNIKKFVELYEKALVSPLGNPHQLKDEDWLPIEKSSLFESPIYGRLQSQSSKLLCFNLITRHSIVFKYALINGNNRIVSWKHETTTKNTSFNMEDISEVVTIDISFIEITKPSVIEYVGPPDLNIHLPNDFFYPFRSNESCTLKSNLFTMILYCITIVSSITSNLAFPSRT